MWAMHIQSSQCLKFHVKKTFLKYLLCKDFVSVTTLGNLQYGELESWLKTCSNMVEKNYTFVKSFLIWISQRCTWEAFENYTSIFISYEPIEPDEGLTCRKDVRASRNGYLQHNSVFHSWQSSWAHGIPGTELHAKDLHDGGQASQNLNVGGKQTHEVLFHLRSYWLLLDTGRARNFRDVVSEIQLMAWHSSTYRQTKWFNECKRNLKEREHMK